MSVPRYELERFLIPSKLYYPYPFLLCFDVRSKEYVLRPKILSLPPGGSKSFTMGQEIIGLRR
jgi:hypothetical protein